MRRMIELSLVASLVLALPCLVMAAGVGKQAPKTRMAGMIEQVNAKQHTITVKATAPGQQIQIQAGARQKPAGPATMVFSVDATTKIASKAGRSKGAAQEQISQEPFGLLQVGQFVSVAYADAAAPAAEQVPQVQGKKKPQPAAQQEAQPAPKPVPAQTPATGAQPEGAAAPQSSAAPEPTVAQDAKGDASPAQGQLPKVMHAVSIEILIPAKASKPAAVKPAAVKPVPSKPVTAKPAATQEQK